MRSELKKYSTVGNREGILLLCSKIFTGKREKLSSIRTSCSFVNGATIYFNCAEMLFKDIGLIDIQGDICLSKGLNYDKIKEEEFVLKLCEQCFNYLISEDYINKELIRFDEDVDSFYIPKAAFNLDCAILRNLLKELSALNISGTKFYIAHDYEHLFYEFVRKKKTMSQEDLLIKLEKEQRMGEEGEAFVLEYETKRLNVSGAQAKKIKQISLIDVAAGYDIISYHDSTFRNRRYIEVKTYHGNEHFYWSPNELEAAKLRRKDYYIYLVKHSEINKEGYEPLMIADPYIEVVKSNLWNVEPDGYYIEKNSNERVIEKAAIDINSESSCFNKNLNSDDDKTAGQEKEKSRFHDEFHPDCVPLYAIRVACGIFTANEGSDTDEPEIEGWVDVSGCGFTPDKDKYFAVYAKGDSMSPDIKDGDICVFEWYKEIGGSREGRIVLVYSEEKLSDGSTYTIKKYHSIKEPDGDSWMHKRIILEPLNPDFKPIELEEGQKVNTIGILKCVL